VLIFPRTFEEASLRFRCEICIRPRDDILDPQGDAVGSALGKLGFAVENVRVGRYVLVGVDSESKEAAAGEAAAMCEKLLVNPITEDFEVRIL
jgi:phosphoribosylformylglycinamidine synthase